MVNALTYMHKAYT